MASVDRMTQNFFLMTKPASPSCTPPNVPQKGAEDKGLSQAGRCVQLQQWCFPGRIRRKLQTEQPLQLRTILPGSSREQLHPKGLLEARSVGDLGSVQLSQRPLGCRRFKGAQLSPPHQQHATMLAFTRQPQSAPSRSCQGPSSPSRLPGQKMLLPWLCFPAFHSQIFFCSNTGDGSWALQPLQASALSSCSPFSFHHQKAVRSLKLPLPQRPGKPWGPLCAQGALPVTSSPQGLAP